MPQITAISDSAVYEYFISKEISLKKEWQKREIQDNYADYLSKQDPYYNKLLCGDKFYWIIRLKNGSLVGSIDSTEYLHRRKELRIPENLNLLII